MKVRPSPTRQDRSFPVFETPEEVDKAYLFASPIIRLLVAKKLLPRDVSTISADMSIDQTHFPKEPTFSSPDERIIEAGEILGWAAELEDDVDEAVLMRAMSASVRQHFAGAVTVEPVISPAEDAVARDIASRLFAPETLVQEFPAGHVLTDPDLSTEVSPEIKSPH